ncbi:MAG: hypothetical protein IID45_14470 [Planctomycetes bacterium]|nr:hypothetical protein [Planctomycetota bacterium]
MDWKDGHFTLDDFLRQMRELNRLGAMQLIEKMIPGMEDDSIPVQEVDFRCIEGVILSMTAEERNVPDLLDQSRRCRIAVGSGTSVPDVNNVLRQFEGMKRMMQSMHERSMSEMGIHGWVKHTRNMARGRLDWPSGNNPDRPSR